MAKTSEIVQRLGGAELLAERFNLSLKAIEMWERREAIPGRWHIDLLLLAKERRVKLSFDDLPKQSQRAA